MTTTTENLHALANEILQQAEGSVDKAAPMLARELMANAKRPLLIALAADYLARMGKPARLKAPLPRGRRREGPHRRMIGMPTAEQKRGRVAAAKMIQHAIYERRIRGAGKLGDIHVHELRAIAESQAMTATSFLQRGYDDAVESILLLMLSDYCVTSEPFVKVRDAIPPKVVEEKLAAATIKAAEVIRDGSIKVASDLIASARSAEVIGDARQ